MWQLRLYRYNFFTLLACILSILNCNSIENNSLEQEKLPSYKEAQKMIKIKECLSELNRSPPDYTTVVDNNNNHNELNSTAIVINSIDATNTNDETNSTLNNNSSSIFVNHPKYLAFNICWLIAIVTTIIILPLKNKSSHIIFIVIGIFFIVHYVVTKICRKTSENNT